MYTYIYIYIYIYVYIYQRGPQGSLESLIGIKTIKINFGEHLTINSLYFLSEAKQILATIVTKTIIASTKGGREGRGW